MSDSTADPATNPDATGPTAHGQAHRPEPNTKTEKDEAPILEQRDTSADGRYRRAIFSVPVDVVVSVGTARPAIGELLAMRRDMVLPLSSFTTALEAPAVRQVVEESLALQGRLVELAIAVITAAFLGIGTAYMAILETVYYLDERVRKEGFDLELRLRELEERSIPSARQSP